jgi:UDP-glucose 4-epimerase
MRPDSTFGSRTVLVTGATGFLGKHLTTRLHRAGAVVHGVSRVARTSTPVDAMHWWPADLTDYAQVEELLGAVQPDVVFHLAGHVTAAPEIAQVLPTFRSLAVSAVNLLTAASRREGTRVILAGSLAEPLAGVEGSTPMSPYGAAKSTASSYGRLFHQLYGAPVTVAHLAYTYGPDQSPAKLIPAVAIALLEGRTPRLSSGRLRADWTFVDDMVEGLLATAACDGAVGQSVDLGSGTLVSVREVVELLARLVGTQVQLDFGVLPDRRGEQFRPANIARTRALIGWQATTSLADGLRRTIDWYRARTPDPQAALV